MALKRFDEVLSSCDAYLARENAHRRDPGDPRPGPGGTPGLPRRDRRLHPGHRAPTRASSSGRGARLLNRRGWAYHFADAPRLALADFEPRCGWTRTRATPSPAVAWPGSAWASGVPPWPTPRPPSGWSKTSPPGEDGPTPRRQAYFNAARIYAQAVEFAADEVTRQGERAVTLYRTYRSRALDLLQQALEQVPADRAGQAPVRPRAQATPPRLRNRTTAAAPMPPVRRVTTGPSVHRQYFRE